MPYYKGSWYSQLPAFGWFDPEDRPGSAAYQVGGRPIPDSQQGIALPNRGTLGKWFNVTPPGGNLPFPMQQTDVGPAKWTGRGVDVSAAAAHQMGYTPKNFPTDAAWKIEPRDEPRGLGSPAGMPVQAGDIPDNTTDDATASGPSGPGRREQQGPKMPAASLMDMISGKAPLEFSPRDYAGNQIGIGDAIAQNSNSLVGLGMGLLQPYRPGESPYSAALQGFQAGSVADSRRGYQQAQLQHQKTQEARQAAQDKIAQQNWERQFARGGETPYQKMQADLARAAGTPEEQQVRDFYRSQLDAGPPQTREIFDPTLGRNVIQEWDSRSKQYKTATTGGGAPAAGATAPGPGGGAAASQPVQPAKKPLTAHEQTAIDEADKAVIANRGVIGTLQDAKRLSKNSFSGLYPTERAQIGAQIPDFLPGMSSNQTAKNTLLLNNAVVSQAVEQLKATFGGNPSEGERKILLEMAGSTNSPDSVRQDIYDRAIKAANERLALNHRRAQEIRGGTYYNPGGERAAGPQSQPAPTSAPPPQAIRALRNNPKMRDEFDAKYGEGSAMRALRGE